MISFLAMMACSETKDDTGTEDIPVGTSSEDSAEEETETETETSICDEDYSVCGSIMMPDTFEGNTVSMSIALFASLPPAGPPDYSLAQVETPEFTPGEAYPVEIGAVTALGEYFLFVAVYMEGGGEWQPASGIDYMYSSEESFSFMGGSVDFGEVNLMLAE